MSFPENAPFFEFDDEETSSLADLLDRLLDHGVVVHGELTLGVAGVDLIYVGVRALVSSVETAERYMLHHIDSQSSPQPGPGSASGSQELRR